MRAALSGLRGDTYLFRVEALAHAGHRQYGSILLTRPVSHTALVCLFAAAAAAIVVFLVSFSVTRKAQVAGALVPAHGVLQVVEPQGGVVLQRPVREGSPVKSGDVLFVLPSERASVSSGRGAELHLGFLRRRRLAERNCRSLGWGSIRFRVL